MLCAAMLLLTVCVGAESVCAQSISAAFTYQGLLADNGNVADGSYDIQFTLYSTASGGSALGTVTKTGVAVNGGLVNTQVDFGGANYDGQVRWVEVRIRPAGSGGAYTVLSPRQALTGTPYALGLPMPFNRTVATGNAAAFSITNKDTGPAFFGVVPSGSGNPALWGIAEGPAGIGVQGSNTSGGVGGIGVQGTAGTSGAGVVGSGGTGVRATSETGSGVIALSWGVGPAVLAVRSDSDPPVLGISNSAALYGQWSRSGTGYAVYADGNLGASGVKTFVEPHPTDATREIRYAALEGPEAGTYFRGTARLVNGSALIEIPETFAIVTDAQGLTVQLTPIGQAATLYCVTRSLERIEVAGSPDVAFDYQVNGVRKAFADFDAVQENISFVPAAPDVAGFIASLPAESVRRLISNGTLNADGSVNMDTARRLGWDKRTGWRAAPHDG
jgi:hypothetical protein